MKNTNLNQWMWKWHFIGGLVSLPVILILSITGLIYLFKKDYEAPQLEACKKVEVKGTPASFQQQWAIAKKVAAKRPTQLVLPTKANEATEFVAGMRSNKSSVFVNPYTKEVTGAIAVKGTAMYQVRKLHGELLMGGFGTKFVELIASWMVVLILTGLYVWWPKKKWRLGGLFTVRTQVKKRVVWRDMHAVTGFWISILLLITLAGGLPWTDVWGGAFKKIQHFTHTGYPATWRGTQLKSSKVDKQSLSLDKMVGIAKKLHLSGQVSISLPRSKKSVFSVSNHSQSLGDQEIHHFDQYSGKELLAHQWSDVGVLMQGRQWAMRFHQGLFGAWNWWLMCIMAILLTLSSVAAVFAWLLRRKKGKWSVPQVPTQFKVGTGVVFLVILLGILFPLFGASLVLIWGVDLIRVKRLGKAKVSTSNPH